MVGEQLTTISTGETSAIRTGWISGRLESVNAGDRINPQAAKDRGINDGDYVYVDGNPVDRPYRGWKPSDPYYKVARLVIRQVRTRPIRITWPWRSVTVVKRQSGSKDTRQGKMDVPLPSTRAPPLLLFEDSLLPMKTEEGQSYQMK